MIIISQYLIDCKSYRDFTSTQRAKIYKEIITIILEFIYCSPLDL